MSGIGTKAVPVRRSQYSAFLDGRYYKFALLTPTVANPLVRTQKAERDWVEVGKCTSESLAKTKNIFDIVDPSTH